jgi:hypothetical protein
VGVVVNVCEYGVHVVGGGQTTPFGRVDVVMSRRIRIDKSFSAKSMVVESVTRTRKSNFPDIVGVPLICPVAVAKLKPPGSAPEMMPQV